MHLWRFLTNSINRHTLNMCVYFEKLNTRASVSWYEKSKEAATVAAADFQNYLYMTRLADTPKGRSINHVDRLLDILTPFQFVDHLTNKGLCSNTDIWLNTSPFHVHMVYGCHLGDSFTERSSPTSSCMAFFGRPLFSPLNMASQKIGPLCDPHGQRDILENEALIVEEFQRWNMAVPPPLPIGGHF